MYASLLGKPMVTAVDRGQLLPVVCDDLRRLGAPNDGGYVVPIDTVRSARYLVSFGLLFDWSFEEAFLKENPGAIVHCYDHTVSFGHVALHSLGSLVRFAIKPSAAPLHEAAKMFTYVRFFRRHARHFRNAIWYARHSMNDITVDDVFARLDRDGPVFLKVDIEGSEYRVLGQVLDYADRIDAMVVEFHDLDILAQPFNALVAKLRSKFHIVHFHANNGGGMPPDGFPCCVELTFKNKRLFAGEPARSSRSYPVDGLDAPNAPGRADITVNLQT